jgi:uncharacterized membrane protein
VSHRLTCHFSFSRPLHPATVHFPIAFLFLGFGLDIIYQAGDRIPANVSQHLPNAADLTRASYYLILLGLISAVPAVITGLQQNILMIVKQGMYETDGKTIKTKVKAAISHAVVIDISLALTAYAWYARRTQLLAGVIPTKLNIALPYAPEAWVVGAEVAALAIMSFGANIGGSLTYNYGVGFSSLSAAVNKKKQ